MKNNFLPILLATTIVSSGMAFSPANAKEPALPEAPKFEQRFDREQMHKEMAKKMADDLNLTEEQQEKAKAIHEKGKKDIEPLMDEMKDLRQKMDEKRRANMEEFEQILTPEQKAKFDEMKKNAPEHHKKGEHFGPRGPHHMKGEQPAKNAK